MIRGRLVALAACLALHGAAQAESPQPTAEMVAEAKQLFDLLSARPWMTNGDIAAGLSGYFGQEVDARDTPGDATRADFYLIRRDPRTGDITFLWLIGSRAR